MRFYVGIHQPPMAARFEQSFISINRVRGRHKPIPSDRWILDSGAFREFEAWGEYRHTVADYASEVRRLAAINAGLECVVSQDFMCEPFILKRTGLSVRDHQRLTIDRYDELTRLVPGIAVMPVLQGYFVHEYLAHLADYGGRLVPGMRVGVGSVCKRNSQLSQIETILTALAIKRPDLRLHGFGLKTTALGSDLVRRCLWSADSMAWSFAARKQGRDGNDWREAARFVNWIDTMPMQGWLLEA
jgi:hypothetical protein